MILQLLVPQYKENDDVLINLLNSLAVQQGIDLNTLEVLIMNDGTDIHLTEDFLKQYPFSIKYFLSEHKGVSGIRQALLEKATADYVMFCDADDMFASLLGINIIYSNLLQAESEKKPIDILVPMFFQEIITPQNLKHLNIPFVYSIKGDKNKGGIDGVFVHGKVYRRKFLVDEKICWESSLTLNEDSYFNTLALMLAKNVKYCDIPYYIWKYNKNSITRSDPVWDVHNYHTFLESNLALLKQLYERKLYKQGILYICQFIYNCYFTINMPIWQQPQNLIYYNNIKNLMKQYIKKYGKNFESADPKIKEQVYKNQNLTKTGGKPLSISFDTWYKGLKSDK